MADESLQVPDGPDDKILQPETQIPVQLDSLEVDGTRPKVGDMVTLKVDGTVKSIENDCAYINAESINDTDINDLLSQNNGDNEDAMMERMTANADKAGMPMGGGNVTGY
jgi:hypothetical protein